MLDIVKFIEQFPSADITYDLLSQKIGQYIVGNRDATLDVNVTMSGEKLAPMFDLGITFSDNNRKINKTMKENLISFSQDEKLYKLVQEIIYRTKIFRNEDDIAKMLRGYNSESFSFNETDVDRMSAATSRQIKQLERML